MSNEIDGGAYHISKDTINLDKMILRKHEWPNSVDSLVLILQAEILSLLFTVYL